MALTARYEGNIHRSAPAVFEDIVRTFVRPLNVDRLLCRKVDGYEGLANTVGLTTTLESVPQGNGDHFSFRLTAEILQRPLIVRLTKTDVKSFNTKFQPTMQRVTTSVGSAVTADSSVSPAMRALGASVGSLSSQVAALSRQQGEQEQQLDQQQRDLLHQSNEMVVVKRKFAELQRQVSDDVTWVHRLAEDAKTSVRKLQAQLPLIQTAIETTMGRKLAGMEASAAERMKKIIIEMVTTDALVTLDTSDQPRCYVCLEDIEPGIPLAYLCDQPSHGIHVECCQGIIAAAGTDTGDGYHRFSRIAKCGCCRQRRDGAVG